jgi:hypothetical protein
MNSLLVAAANDCNSVAFPLISSGIYGYPKADALAVATGAIHDFLLEHEMDVYLVVWDDGSFAVSSELLGRVESYIDAHYVAEHTPPRRSQYNFEPLDHKIPSDGLTESIAAGLAAIPKSPVAGAALTGLDAIVGRLDEPFTATLLRLIDKSGKPDAQVYKRANIDRRLFSKIRGNPHYAPSKPTVLAFAVALELSLDMTADLLARAGFALSRSRKFDVIVEYFISNGEYDIFEINEVLFHYDQSLLGG